MTTTGHPIPASLPVCPPWVPTAMVLPPRLPEPVEDLWEPYTTARRVHVRDDHTTATQLKSRTDRERGEWT